MKDEVFQAHKSSLGDVDANVMAMVAYLIGIITIIIPGLGMLAWVAPLLIFLLEKNSSFVRFHAMQSLVLNIASAVIAALGLFLVAGISIGMSINPFAFLGGMGMLGLILGLVNLAIIIFSVIAAVKAYGYIEYHVPLVADIANSFVKR